jgi:hypothetical protein
MAIELREISEMIGLCFNRNEDKVPLFTHLLRFGRIETRLHPHRLGRHRVFFYPNSRHGTFFGCQPRIKLIILRCKCRSDMLVYVRLLCVLLYAVSSYGITFSETERPLLWYQCATIV